MKEKQLKPLDLVDYRAYARELNRYNLDKKLEDWHLTCFFEKMNPRGYVNALDLELIEGALRKSGAMEIKKEPVVSIQRFKNMTAGRLIEHPCRYDVRYCGPVDFKKFYALIYN